jgi:hypothetical protein
MTANDGRKIEALAPLPTPPPPAIAAITMEDGGAGFLSAAAVDGRASVLTLDGRATASSMLTKDCCNGPTAEGVAGGAKFICPWNAAGMPAVLCRRHRSAWDLCGLVLILLLCLLLILVLCFLHPCLFHNSCAAVAGGGTQTVRDGGDDASGGTRLCLTAECVQTAASLLAAMDHTVDPCTDFFQVKNIYQSLKGTVKTGK